MTAHANDFPRSGPRLHQQFAGFRSSLRRAWFDAGKRACEVPVHTEMSRQDVIFLDETEPTSSPMKAKGVGEFGIGGAAIANAIYNATGVRGGSVRSRGQAAGGVASGSAKQTAKSSWMSGRLARKIAREWGQVHLVGDARLA